MSQFFGTICKQGDPFVLYRPADGWLGQLVQFFALAVLPREVIDTSSMPNLISTGCQVNRRVREIWIYIYLCIIYRSACHKPTKKKNAALQAGMQIICTWQEDHAGFVIEIQLLAGPLPTFLARDLLPPPLRAVRGELHVVFYVHMYLCIGPASRNCKTSWGGGAISDVHFHFQFFFNFFYNVPNVTCSQHPQKGPESPDGPQRPLLEVPSCRESIICTYHTYNSTCVTKVQVLAYRRFLYVCMYSILHTCMGTNTFCRFSNALPFFNHGGLPPWHGHVLHLYSSMQ